MKIPTLLAGPIIRRVEPQNVYIWLVTSKDFAIEAALYQNDFDEEIRTYTETKRIHVGTNMYFHLINISPFGDAFPTDSLIGYNLFFTNKDETLDLGSFNLLSTDNPNSIVYGDLKYPSFFIQHNCPCNILYGSCRKPHGKGNDVLASADETIQEDYLNLTVRPSSLFLMGDQIYADDVADPLFFLISSWSNRLISEEKKNIADIDPRLNSQTFYPDKLHARQYIMDKFAAFTSGNADNHLIRLGEYFVMYLMTLGPALWDNTEIPLFEELIEDNEYYFMYTEKNQKQRAKELKKHQARYYEQLKDLLTFTKTLPQIRRVLANTPTYMIFDDHDITDDWNLSLDWKENVWNAPLGRHVIAHGLTAYWLFQGWGNDPKAFDGNFTKLLAYHTGIFTKRSYFDEEWIKILWDSRFWNFVTPTNPKAIFLDIRTSRDFDLAPQPIRIGNIIDEGTNAPHLIGKDGWKTVSNTLLKSGWATAEPLIIVSPTPLYGIGIVESALNRYVYPLRILGLPIKYTADFEAWKYNGTGFNSFLQQIMAWNPSQCYVLSGDVHYAGAIRSRVEFSDSEQITINQFTSSPIRNMSFSGLWGFLLKIFVWFNSLKRRKRSIKRCCDNTGNLIMGRGDSDNVKWNENIEYLSSKGGKIIITDNNLGLLTVNGQSAANKLLKHEQEVIFKA
ncbi:hypothetical protein [Virgibacillus sp. JSM 102003]|uniref:hypothetical protein n=1 Tax=Virgibacillus sp. JSM 102003 TaxID=1562108 RepID=UPI0035C1A742